MNTYVLALVAVVAVLSKGASAGCLYNPCLSAPVLSPIVSPYITAPILPTTTIVQTNSVTESLVDVLQLATVTSLLNEKLCPNYVGLPIAAPYLTTCGCGSVVSTCGCGCSPIIC